MKTKNKIINIIILVITILSFTTVSYGFGVNELTGTQTEVETLKNAGNNMVKIVLTIGTVISVVMLIVLGIKYMLGSVEEKAEYKKTLMPYVIGAGIVFASSAIAQLIYNVATTVKLS